MFAKDSGLLQGTLELLVLKTLSWGPMHGYAVASWIESEWGLSENNRRAKYYQLTREGRAQLGAKSTSWARYAAAVSRVLAVADGWPS